MERVERPPSDPELKRRIQELINYKGDGHNTDLVADIIENALKIYTDVQGRGDVRVIQTAVRELRYAFKLFAPHAHVRKVTMFGSARTAGWSSPAPGRASCRPAMKVRGRKKVLAPTSACRGNKARTRSSSTTKS